MSTKSEVQRAMAMLGTKNGDTIWLNSRAKIFVGQAYPKKDGSGWKREVLGEMGGYIWYSQTIKGYGGDSDDLAFCSSAQSFRAWAQI